MATVETLTATGELTPRKRVTAEDLEFAATWLEAYEGEMDNDADNLIALATVARSLRMEAERRQRARRVAQVARQARQARREVRR